MAGQSGGGGDMMSGIMQLLGMAMQNSKDAYQGLNYGGVANSARTVLGKPAADNSGMVTDKKSNKTEENGGGFSNILKNILGNIGNNQVQPATGLNKYYQDYQSNPPASTTPGLTGSYEDYYNQPAVLGRLGSRTYYQ
jgi:hypothetical protein